MPEAQAFWTVAAGRGELRSGPVPDPLPGEVRVRTVASGISRGTEALVFSGRVPPSQAAVMRAPFQAGEFPFPVKYGYSAVGIVEAGGSDWVGRRVFCLHPHQDRFVVPEAAVVPVPDQVPDRRAVLAANLETAINALWDAEIGIGDRVAVVGAGVIGTLVAILAHRIPGAEVTLVDVDPGRRQLAAALGLRFALPGERAEDADLVVHASASAAGLAEALRLAAFEATVLELSWYGAAPVPVPLGEAFHSRRLVLRSSQVGAIPPQRRSRFDAGRRLRLALRLLEDPAFDLLLEDPVPFARLPEVMEALSGDAASVMCQVIEYP